MSDLAWKSDLTEMTVENMKIWKFWSIGRIFAFVVKSSKTKKMKKNSFNTKNEKQFSRIEKKWMQSKKWIDEKVVECVSLFDNIFLFNFIVVQKMKNKIFITRYSSRTSYSRRRSYIARR